MVNNQKTRLIDEYDFGEIGALLAIAKGAAELGNLNNIFGAANEALKQINLEIGERQRELAAEEEKARLETEEAERKAMEEDVIVANELREETTAEVRERLERERQGRLAKAPIFPDKPETVERRV